MRRIATAPLLTLAGCAAFTAAVPTAANADGAAPLVIAQTAPARPADASAALVTVDVKQVRGSETLAVRGTAPASQPLRLTLLATFSRDIPDVVLSRQTVLSSADGTFAATMPIAPGFYRGALLTVVAATAGTGQTGSAHVTVGAPNVTVPPDNLPSDVK